MNRDQLKKCERKIVRIQPPALFVGDDGREEPADIDWLVERCFDDRIDLVRYDIGMGHRTTMGNDHVHHYASDLQRGENYGFLILTSQIYIKGNKLWLKPGVRP